MVFHDRISPYAAAYSAAAFLIHVRGLPLDELEIEARGKKVYFEYNKSRSALSLIMRRPRVFGRGITEIFGAEVLYRTSCVGEKNIALIPVAHAEHFSIDALKAFLGSFDIAVAYSVSESGELSVRADSILGDALGFFPEIASAAACSYFSDNSSASLFKLRLLDFEVCASCQKRGGDEIAIFSDQCDSCGENPKRVP